jgi:hypothetical protein
MRSPHPPERLAVELQSLVGPSLSQKGYRLAGHGLAGITWRRELSGKLIAALVILGLLALSGLASGEGGSTLLGVLALVGAALIVYLRRPATVTIHLANAGGGSEVTVAGGPDTDWVTEIVRRVASPPPSVGLP